MSKILKKHSGKAGLPPGTLVHIGRVTDEKIVISIFDYSAKGCIEKANASLEDCLISLDNPLMTWINVRGIHDLKMIETIGHHFSLHPLMLEDIVNSGQRSKLDDYKENIYIVMRLLKYNSHKEEVEDEQVSLILGKNYVISFVESDSDIFASVEARLKKYNSRLVQRSADYLCYALIDRIVDNYFEILEKVDDKLEKLETALVREPDYTVIQKIQHAKREITLLRKSVWPMREVINKFRKLDTLLISDTTKFYMQDVYDHTIQAIDTIESFRDIASGLLDIYISNISLHMNEIMKVLTVVSTIFVPLTFIASIYGMNFEYMPEVHWVWGYPLVLLLMVLTSVGMLLFFRKRRWI